VQLAILVVDGNRQILQATQDENFAFAIEDYTPTLRREDDGQGDYDPFTVVLDVVKQACATQEAEGRPRDGVTRGGLEGGRGAAPGGSGEPGSDPGVEDRGPLARSVGGGRSAGEGEENGGDQGASSSHLPDDPLACVVCDFGAFVRECPRVLPAQGI
jgi:hypothetical protein